MSGKHRHYFQSPFFEILFATSKNKALQNHDKSVKDVQRKRY